LQVGEYISFAESPGGRISRAVTPRQRKLNTLFSRFLDNGEKGLIQGQLFLLEMAGLLLSPVTLTLRLLGHGYMQVARYLWDKVERCAFPHYDFSEPGAARLAHNIDLQGELRDMGANMPSSAADLCKLILQSDVEGSAVSNALSVLDYTRYSAVMTFTDVWGGYLAYPVYAWEVMYRVPVLYWDYYIADRTSLLPPRRQCCLLRSGIDAARQEMERLTQRIAAQEALIRETASKRYITVPSADSDGSTAPARSSRRGKKAAKAKQPKPAEKRVLLDVGPDGSWEAALDTCLEASVGTHDYRFCFFGEITQDGARSLGRFAHWGAGETEQLTGVVSFIRALTVLSVVFNASDLASDRPSSGQSVDKHLLTAGPEGIQQVTAEVLNDLAEHPYVAPVLAALRSGTAAVGGAVSNVVEALGRRNRIIGTTPTSHKIVQVGSSFFQSLYNVVFGSTQPGLARGSGLFGSGEVAKVGFSGTPDEVQAHYSRQVYLGGARCIPGRGTPRRTEVVLECGMRVNITDVVETQVRYGLSNCIALQSVAVNCVVRASLLLSWCPNEDYVKCYRFRATAVVNSMIFVVCCCSLCRCASTA
jgi:hypothetical protein